MNAQRGIARPRERRAHPVPPGPRPPLGRARALALSLAMALGVAGAGAPAAAQTFKVLHRFHGPPKDGEAPLAGLAMDAAGNLYGTTLQGGKYSSCLPADVGCGTVFKLDTNGAETILHSFNGSDGANPISTPIMDASGDLYGTTAVGGGDGCRTENSVGCGLVFKLSSDGKETVLHRFTGGADGAWPLAGLVMDANGILYGTTNSGGTYQQGVVFKLVGTKETVLYAFTGGEDGAGPDAGTLLDVDGILYGTTTYGGDINCLYPDPCGVVYKLAGRRETVLHAFKDSPDGAYPTAGVVMDAAGNLYSTTSDGGNGSNGGTVFEVSQDRKERLLHTFGAGGRKNDGDSPEGGVVFDAYGNLCGTTFYGGKGQAGAVFEITADGKEKILHSFCTTDCMDGASPQGDLVIDANGNLYGTASGGGTNRNGTVFMITP